MLLVVRSSKLLLRILQFFLCALPTWLIDDDTHGVRRFERGPVRGFQAADPTQGDEASIGNVQPEFPRREARNEY